MKKLLLALVVMFLTFSCTEQSSYEYGVINIKLSGAFTDYEQVSLNIESIQILYKTPTSHGQWVDLQNNGSSQYNLLNYKNGESVSIATSNIAPGSLLKIKLKFGENNSVKTKDGTFGLNLANNYNSNFEISYSENFEYEVEKTIVIDFDIQKSVVDLGNDRFEFAPVARAYTDDKQGSIEGMILTISADPHIYIDVDNQKFSTYINNDGYFKLSGLPEGLYELFIIPDIPYVEKSILNVQVSEGATTNLGDIEIESNQIIASNLEGDININPSSSSDELFTMETPIGTIDINVLQDEGDAFNYSGSATEVMVMPKAQGATISVDGQSIELDKNIRYIFTSSTTPLKVNLRNTRNGNGNWWLYLEGDNISIYPLVE